MSCILPVTTQGSCPGWARVSSTGVRLGLGARPVSPWDPFLGRSGGEGASPEGDRGVGLGQMREALQPGERRIGSGRGLSGVMAEGGLRSSGGGGWGGIAGTPKGLSTQTEGRGVFLVTF